MITHVIVELKQPVKEEFFHMDTVLPSEYYGYGTPLVLCKDCKWYSKGSICGVHICTMEKYMLIDVEADDFCSQAERRCE